MAIEYVGKHRVMRRCARCRSDGDDVSWSNIDQMYCCDDCYEEIHDLREQANIDACYSNGEQDY